MACNTECGCPVSRMQPICSKDGVTNFYSPCHAGCRAQELLRPRDTPPDWPGAGNTSLPAAKGDQHIELETNFREDFTIAEKSPVLLVEST